MKKTVIVIVLAVFLLGVGYFSCNREPDPFKGKVITVGILEYPPYQIKDKTTGKYYGFFVDLFEAIAQDQGLRFRYKEIKFQDMFTELPKGTIDLAFPVTINIERERLFSFTWPVDENELFIYTRNDGTTGTLAALKTQKVGAIQGVETGFCQKWQKEGKIKDVIEYEYIDHLFDALKEGKVDAIIVDSFIGKYYELLHPEAFKLGDPVGYYQYIGFPLRKGNELLRKRLNKGIKHIFTNGKYVEIYRKDFSVRRAERTEADKRK